MKLTTHLCLVLRLRMNGAGPLLPLYAFMARAGETSLFTFCSVGPGQLDVTIMCWLDLAQSRNKWRAVVKAVMNFRFP